MNAHEALQQAYNSLENHYKESLCEANTHLREWRVAQIESRPEIGRRFKSYTHYNNALQDMLAIVAEQKEQAADKSFEQALEDAMAAVKKEREATYWWQQKYERENRHDKAESSVIYQRACVTANNILCSFRWPIDDKEPTLAGPYAPGQHD